MATIARDAVARAIDLSKPDVDGAPRIGIGITTRAATDVGPIYRLDGLSECRLRRTSSKVTQRENVA